MSAWFRVQNETRGIEVAAQVERASSFAARLVGLLGRRELPRGRGLWIDPCDSIHTFFMRFPIDALFVDRGSRVVRVVSDLSPWRATRVHREARSCLELAAGAAADTRVGDQLRFAPTREWA